jgi:hypothetical protein
MPVVAFVFTIIWAIVFTTAARETSAASATPAFSAAQDIGETAGISDVAIFATAATLRI